MKSKRAREYLSDICWAGILIYGDPGECDLKLKEAKHAVELAEEDMAEKAAKAFCALHCPQGCSMCGLECLALITFKQKLME